VAEEEAEGSELPIIEPEDPDVGGGEDGGDAFDGLPDLIDDLSTVNGLLEAMIPKLEAVSQKLDEVLSKMKQLDTGGTGGSSGGDEGAGGTPGSEGG
jgi:hypothetical protein